MKLRSTAALLVLCLACNDSTAPKVRLAPVFDIEVPASLPQDDTLSIGFRYSLGCDALDHREVSQTPYGLTFAVWITNRDVDCFESFASSESSHVQLVLPPRFNAFTVRFKQATRDSVLVVTTSSASP